MKRLTRKFFRQNTDEVAKQLLGKLIILKSDQKIVKAIITETESYHGNDPASHAGQKRTNRNEPMFWQAGHLYVYLIYGMYFCLNIVTQDKDYPAAALIRGIKIIEPEEVNLDGPGKLCRYLKIDRSYDRIDFCAKENYDKFGIYDIGLNPEFQATKRIGITQNKDALLRFIVKNV